LIQNKLKKIKNELNDDTTLVAVSKTKPIEEIKSLYEIGHVDFGENKVQELVNKHGSLPKDINWHMIGHLQRNKVRQIIPFIHLIHSVDSLRLLNKINEEAKKINRIVNILIQIKISNDNSKYGFSFDEIEYLIKNRILDEFEFIDVKGLMGMATFTNDENIIDYEFKKLKKFYLKHIPHTNFSILSMGMSDDYRIALKNKSNMLRLGSVIFGKRN
tara:strand:- start:37 stop:684 length:648 start_codon:yes stop_codon:yes gene_type:complete